VSLSPGQVNQYGQGYNCTACASGQTVVDGKCVDSGVLSLFYLIVLYNSNLIITSIE
jgi:hypothetical protein